MTPQLLPHVSWTIETNQLYLLFFPTVPPGFFETLKEKKQQKKFVHLW